MEVGLYEYSMYGSMWEFFVLEVFPDWPILLFLQQKFLHSIQISKIGTCWVLCHVHHEATIIALRLYWNVNKYYILSILKEKMEKISTRCKLVYIY